MFPQNRITMSCVFQNRFSAQNLRCCECSMSIQHSGSTKFLRISRVTESFVDRIFVDARAPGYTCSFCSAEQHARMIEIQTELYASKTFSRLTDAAWCSDRHFEWWAHKRCPTKDNKRLPVHNVSERVTVVCAPLCSAGKHARMIEIQTSTPRWQNFQ